MGITSMLTPAASVAIIGISANTKARRTITLATRVPIAGGRHLRHHDRVAGFEEVVPLAPLSMRL